MANSAYYPKLRALEPQLVKIEEQNLIALTDPLKISKVVMIPLHLLETLQLMDGNHSLIDLQEAFMKRFGEFLFTHELENFVSQLDQNLLLQNENFQQALTKILADFQQNPIREPALAGMGYPGDPQELREFLRSIIEDPTVPEATSTQPPLKGKLVGLIAPHIDFTRGSKGYSVSYRNLLQHRMPDTIIILGIDHSAAPGPLIMTRKQFRTPFGILETDQDVVDEVTAGYPYNPYRGEFAHRTEHSVEFQTVMLHYLYPLNPPKIVPILVTSFAHQQGHPTTPMDNPGLTIFIENVRKLIHSPDKHVCLLSAVDLSHMGAQFGAQPLQEGNLAAIEAFDRALLTHVVQGEPGELYRQVASDPENHNVCGYPSLYLLSAALTGTPGKILDYHQWFDPQEGSCVSFASGYFWQD